MIANVNPLKRDKGSHKDHSYWLSTELNDYVCKAKADYIDTLKQYDALLSDTTQPKAGEKTTSGMLKKKRPYQYLKTNKMIQMNFTFLPNMAKLPVSVLISISSFLHVKDIVNLTLTCKQLSTTFSNEDMWKKLCKRDFNNTRILDFRLPNVECAKSLYKYIVCTDKSGVLYHTGLFWKDATSLASDLTQSLVDFVGPKHYRIKEIMRIIMLRNDSVTGNILKLSWMRENNEVRLWISGQVFVKLKENEADSEKTEKLTAHVLKVYRGLDDEVIQNAFFMEDRYLVIEVATILDQSTNDYGEKDDKLIQKSPSTFIFYDLEKELRCFMTGEDFAEPFRYSYDERPNLEGDNQEKKEINHTQAIEINRDIIKIKLFTEEEAICYTKNTDCPWIKIVNLKTKRESACVKVELDSPIEDIVLMKHTPLSKRNSFFVIDKALNVYVLTWANDCLTLVRKFILENEEILAEDRSTQIESVKSFPGIYRYHQGAYQKPSKYEQDILVEYLIIHKESVLHFIDLETLEVHKYMIPNMIYNWTVHEDKLFFIFGNQILIYQFSFRDFEIRQLRYLRTQSFNMPSFISQFIFVSSCFTVHINFRQDPGCRDDVFEVHIGSTQHMLTSEYARNLYEQYREFKVISLLRKNRLSVLPEIDDGQFEIRFGQNYLFMKREHKSVLFELENYWRTTSYVLGRRWDYERISFFGMTTRKEEVKEEKQVEKVKVINYKEIPVNKNNDGKQEKINKWLGIEKDGNKEENREKRIIKQKGRKYRKNVQQNQRLEKCY